MGPKVHGKCISKNSRLWVSNFKFKFLKKKYSEKSTIMDVRVHEKYYFKKSKIVGFEFQIKISYKKKICKIYNYRCKGP